MIARSFLLFLSRNQRLRRWMETSKLAGRLTSRFVAGLTLEEALAVGRQLNTAGVLVTLDHLGENVTSEAEAAAAADAYLEAVEQIGALGLQATVSIKLTQFGLDLSYEIARRNACRLAERARQRGTVVEIDMEASPYVDDTLRLVTELHENHASVRAVIQAYLRRSQTDIQMLCGKGIPVRLCKGAYREPPDIAFQTRREVDANYVRLLRILLERGVYPGLATHDERMIEAARRFAGERGIAPPRFEFQMLYGIRRGFQRRLVAGGYRVRVYVPYGRAWYPYLMRRLAERPANVWMVARNLSRR